MTTIKLRRGTASQWASTDPILAQGEPGFESDTNKHKIGDGVTAWSGLNYFIDETAVDIKVSSEAVARSMAITDAVNTLVNGAPGALDTLNELAAQLGSDETAAGALTTLVSNVRNLTDTTHNSALNGAYLPKWRANQAYTMNDLVLDSSGMVIQRNANGTSRSSYDTTEQALWTVKTATGGALSGVQAAVTANGALVVGLHNPVDATSSNRTMTLADATAAGKIVTVSKKDSSSNTVTISLTSLRDSGAASLVLAGQHESIILLSKADGSWWPVGDHKTKTYLDTTYVKTSSVEPPTFDFNFSDLESALTATPVGGVLEIRRAWSRSTAFTISKACTVRFVGNGKITFSASNLNAIDVTSDNVRIENPVVQGPGITFNTGCAISIKGVAATRRDNFTVVGGELWGFPRDGIAMENANNLRVENVYIHDVGYAGIEKLSLSNVKILYNRVENVTQPSGFVNSYGIANGSNYNIAGNTFCTNVLVEGNIVRDVVNWEGMDTHAGSNVKFLNNYVFNCLYGIVVIGGKNLSGVNTYPPSSVTVSGNYVDSTKTDGSANVGIILNGVPGSGGVSLGVATGIICTNNTIVGHGNDAASDNNGGISVHNTKGCIISGNSIIEPAAKGINIYDTNIGLVVTDNTVVDVWLNASDNGTTGAYVVRSDYNKAYISGNSLVRGTKSATLVNHKGIFIYSSATNNVITLGTNDVDSATAPVTDTGNMTQVIFRAKKMGVFGNTPVVRPTANSVGLVEALTSYGWLASGTTVLGSAAYRADTYFATPADVSAAVAAANASLPSTITSYSTAQTDTAYTIPSGAIALAIRIQAPGSGGGSGRRGAAGTLRTAGGSGAGGPRTETRVSVATLTAAGISALRVTVGAGGVGGAAITTDDTNGVAGLPGGNSYILTGTSGARSASTILAEATASTTGGGAGTNSGAASGGNSAPNGTFPNSGGGTSSSATGGAAGGSVNGPAGSGGAGGGITTADVASAGGAGGYPLGGYPIQITAGAINTSGGNGTNLPGLQGGWGGAGGGSSIVGVAGSGGNGGRGAGGGGGGASLNGNNSGKGGNGGDGFVEITAIF